MAFLVPLIAQITASLKGQGQRQGQRQRPDQGGHNSLQAASPSALIVSPTRELATQIELEAHKLTYASPIQCVCVYGGASSQQQLALLAKGVDILIATPGRLNDFLSQRLITLNRINFCVLDEADRMLDMGFEPQIRQICEQYDLPSAAARNTLMFSATFPTEVQKIAQKYMRPYVFVAVGRVGSTVSSITQKVVPVRANETILPLIVPTDKTIVFCQKKHVANWVKTQLMRALPGGVRVDAIHGDRNQSQREHALELFRAGKLEILVATDVAARGLDVPGINHVIQFDLPVSSQDFDNYVHRIGRTGRAGRLGLATALFVPGVDAKMGQNGALLKPLCELLVEGKQEVPDWLMALRGGGGGGGVRGEKQGQQGQGQGQGQGKQQPQRDARSKSQVVTVSTPLSQNTRAGNPATRGQQPKQQQQQQQPRRQRDGSTAQRSSTAPLPQANSTPAPGRRGQAQGQAQGKKGGRERSKAAAGNVQSSNGNGNGQKSAASRPSTTTATATGASSQSKASLNLKSEAGSSSRPRRNRPRGKKNDGSAAAAASSAS